VSQLNLQISALEKQLKEENDRLASPQAKTINAVVEEFQRLEMEAGFAQDLYRTGLAALEKGRVEAIRTLKKVSILQNPTRPQYPLEPQRIYNIAVYFLSALATAGIVYLLAAIIRDHKD
jgi:capsular polysaccharide transport system permease protein